MLLEFLPPLREYAMGFRNEERLFERYQRRGDVEALGGVFDRTAPTLLRVAMHLEADSVAAEDLLQATFLKAIEAAATWDADQPLIPWLLGIMRHRSQQRNARESRRPDAERLVAAIVEGDDPITSVQGRELNEAVDAAIADLPEIYRAVLRLSLGYGHTPAEIAHALERSPGTVRSQLARGLRLLRRGLPMGFAMGVAATALCGRGLAAVRAVVVRQAAASCTAASVGGLTGGVLFMKKTLVAIGLACAAVTLSILGGTFAFTLDSKVRIATLAFGFTTAHINLTPFGAPGCFAHMQDPFLFVAIARSSTGLSYSFPIPRGLKGVDVLTQWLVPDPTVNSAKAVVSDARRLEIQ